MMLATALMMSPSRVSFTGLLATIMSTADSTFLLSAITLGHDLFARLGNRRTEAVKLTRLGLIISAVASIILALLFPSVIQLWYLIGTLFIPPMLLPVLGSYYRLFRMDRRFALWNMLAAFSVSLIFLLQSLRISPSITGLNYWLGIQPMYPGLMVSGFIFLGEKIFRNKKRRVEN